MGSLKLTTASSGSVILSPANTASDVTITVPASTATMAIDGPAFFATMTSNQSVTNASNNLIQFNSVSGGNGFDTSSCFNTTSYKFTPNVAGYYYVTISIQGPSSSSGLIVAHLYKNGSEFGAISACANVSGGAIPTGSTLVYCNGTTDYLQAYVYQNTGGTATIYSGSTNGSFFCASMVRSA